MQYTLDKDLQKGVLPVYCSTPTENKKMFLSQLEIIGLMLFIQIDFVPISIVALNSMLKMQAYIRNMRITRVNGTPADEPWLVDFMISNKGPYNFLRKTSDSGIYILPYELFVVLMIAGAALNTLAVFWVWAQPEKYAYWAYVLTILLHLVNVLAVGVWHYMFFLVPNYKGMVFSSVVLLVISLLTIIILLVVAPHRWNVYVFNGLTLLYYTYMLVISTTFYHVNKKNNLYRIRDDDAPPTEGGPVVDIDVDNLRKRRRPITGVVVTDGNFVA